VASHRGPTREGRTRRAGSAGAAASDSDGGLSVASAIHARAASADGLFADPYAGISGNRVLGDWFAAQLLDSALFRSVAVCDRLAILLWVRAGREIPTTKRGREHHPAFTPRHLDVLVRDYGEQAEWASLRALADNELFTFTKELRDGFTHSRRLVSELHGEPIVAYAMEAPKRGVDADEHRALALAFYDVILRPAIGLGGVLLGNRSDDGCREAATA